MLFPPSLKSSAVISSAPGVLLHISWLIDSAMSSRVGGLDNTAFSLSHNHLQYHHQPLLSFTLPEMTSDTADFMFNTDLKC